MHNRSLKQILATAALSNALLSNIARGEDPKVEPQYRELDVEDEYVAEEIEPMGKVYPRIAKSVGTVNGEKNRQVMKANAEAKRRNKNKAAAKARRNNR